MRTCSGASDLPRKCPASGPTCRVAASCSVTPGTRRPCCRPSMARSPRCVIASALQKRSVPVCPKNCARWPVLRNCATKPNDDSNVPAQRSVEAGTAGGTGRRNAPGSGGTHGSRGGTGRRCPNDAPAETDEEAAERADIDAARARLVAERDRLSAERDASIGRIEAAVAALPPAFDRGRLELARRASVQSEAGLRSAEQAHLAAVRTQERRAALQAQQARVSGEAAATDARASAVESELSGWTLLASA